jgi:hypothetical protein
MNLPASGKGDLFETEAFCLSVPPRQTKKFSLCDLCGERKQFYALLNMITRSAFLPTPAYWQEGGASSRLTREPRVW